MRRGRRRRLEDAFNDCVERVRRGATVEECLAAYPTLADDLCPLLTVVTPLWGASTLDPPRQVKEAVHARLQHALAQGLAAGGAVTAVRRARWRMWAVGTAAIVLALSLGGIGAVQASSESLPGQSLYPVKSSVEWVQLQWPWRSDAGEAELQARLARRRAIEMAQVAQEGDGSRIPALSRRLATRLEQSTYLSLGDAAHAIGGPDGRPAGPRPPLISPEPLSAPVRHRLLAMRGMLERDYQRSLDQLRFAESRASPEAVPAIQAAVHYLSQRYQWAMQLIEARLGPGAQPFGWPTPQLEPRQHP